jgi:hypothetical protein
LPVIVRLGVGDASTAAMDEEHTTLTGFVLAGATEHAIGLETATLWNSAYFCVKLSIFDKASPGSVWLSQAVSCSGTFLAAAWPTMTAARGWLEQHSRQAASWSIVSSSNPALVIVCTTWMQAHHVIVRTTWMQAHQGWQNMHIFAGLA